MFVIKSLLGKMWGNPANPELIQIPAGQLYLVRPDSIKGSRECIFKDAVATIRRTGTEFQYQLVVTRAYEEGEEQLLEEDAESDDERSFLIDEQLEFRFGSLDGDATCAWRDLSGDDDDLWEFVSSRTVPRATNSLFELTILNCMFERKYSRSHEEASEAQLEALRYREPQTARVPAAKPAARASSSTPAVTPAAPASPAKSAEAGDASEAVEVEDPFADVPILHRATSELYLFDTEADIFVIQEKEVTADLASNGDYDTWLIVRQGKTPFISLPIDAEMVPRFDLSNHAFMFTFREQEGLPNLTWCLKFPSDTFTEWKEKFTIYLWEGKNKVSYAKAKADEQRYIQDAYGPNEDDEMDGSYQERMAALDKEDEEEAVLDQVDEEEEEEEEEESGEDDDMADFNAAKRGKNEHLTMGYRGDSAFVNRGDMIGVFNTKDRDVKWRATIDRVADLKGKAFTPKKMMLHSQDTNMLMLDGDNRNAVFRMDLERGKIVDEWKVSDDVEVNNIIADSKFAQATAQQTFVGHSHNGLFRIDPRVSGNKLVQSEFKQYASKNQFSSAATTESGRLAVASNKGDIRLFDAIGKNAKTALPALGDPIIGVDVSADGRWLVATCKTYLLLIDTLIGDGRYKGSLGFDRSFPADSKPMPKRLQLKPEHVAYMTDAVSFTPARFNQSEEAGAEKSIVTSTGNYIVTWNFKHLKAGRLDTYSIKQYSSKVVADNFTFGQDKKIVVALENDVLMANKKELLKPTRQSLAPHANLSTPVKKLRGASKNDIVHSPY